VPHRPQNVRMTGGEDRYSTGVPKTKENPLAGNVTHATVGEPAALRHDRQWHSVAFDGCPTAT
jgi:hypothetical protein